MSETIQVKPGAPKNEPRLLIWVLGDFEVRLEGRALGQELSRRSKAGQILKLLAVAPNQRLPREKLMAIIWPDLDGDSAANNLSRNLFEARRILEPRHESSTAFQFLRLEQNQLTLAGSGNVWIDAVEFERLASQCTDRDACEQALRLYRGELLPGDRVDGWAAERRRKFHELYISVLRAAAQFQVADDDMTSAITTLETLIAAERTDEPAYVWLMRLVAGQGDRTRAVRLYRRLEQHLRFDLDAEPGPDARAMLQVVLTGRSDLEMSGPSESHQASQQKPPTSEPASERPDSRPVSVQSAPRDAVRNAPNIRRPMIGREHELGVVCDLLQRPEVAILTLTGPGGIGKTRLALEAAFSLAESFPDQVAWVSLAAISDPGLVMSAVGRALGLPEDLGQPAVESVKAHLHGKSALIVLDSFEQVAEAAIDVAELLTSCPRLKLLITSRRPLHLSDEYEFPVPSLTVPDATRPALVYELARCPSVALFVERAAAVRPGFGLTELNARSVASICARLDGLPLAIELAATRIRFLTPEAMLARLERSLPMLEGGAADMPARHRTLRATTAWSYELLTDEEKRLFRHCSVFVGGFSLEAVERVCSQDGQSGLGVLGGLASLVDQSLILQEEHTSGDPRFTELQTIREFALEQLEHSNEAMVLRQAHAAYFLSLIQESELMLLAASDEDCLNRVEREHDNFRAVLQYALETGDTEPGLLLAGTLRPFWQIRGHMREGMDWLTRLLACSSPERRTIGRAKALNAAGFASVMLGDYERALQLGRESLSIYRELEQPQGIIEALHHLGLAQRCIGRFDDSRDTFEEALAATRNIGQHLWEGRVLHGYARTAFNAGDPNRSRQLLEQALDCKPEVEDTLARAMVLTDLADVTRGTGDHPASMEALREAFEIWQRLGHVRGVAQCLEALAFLLSDRSDAASVAELIVRLLASASAIRVRIADPSSPYRRGEIGRVLEGTRQSVSTAAFDESWQRGQQADPDGLFTEAFEQLMTLAAAYAG